jgi:MFS transporter, SP family, galactose:H+ symporter
MSKQVSLYLIAALAATGGLLFGYDTGIIAAALPFITDQWHLSASDKEWIVSAVLLGGIVGSLSSGRLADRLGRRRTNQLTAVLFVVASFLTGWAPDQSWLIFGRFIIGVAVGIASYAVPLYIAEVAPANIRGRVVTLFQLAITVGILASYAGGYWLSGSDDGWRNMFLLGFVPGMILLVGMFFVPESPRWLLGQGREADAKQALDRFETPEQAAQTLSEVKQHLASEAGQKVPWTTLFSKRLRRPLFIGIGIFLIQQFSGINAVIYYAPEIFKMAGFADTDVTILATVGVGVCNVFFTIVSLWLLDRWGRRPILFTGLAGVTVSLALLGWAFYQKEALGDSLRWISVGSTLLFIAFFAISLGPLGWLLISEVYPLQIRGVAMSFGSFYHWFFDFLVSFSFLTLAAKLGAHGVFWLYMCFPLLGFAFAYYLVPETKGKSLEEIENMWE